MLPMNWKSNKFLIFLGDVVIVFSALALAIFIRRPGYFSVDYYNFNLGFFVFIFPLWFLVYYILGLYDLRHINRSANLTREVIISFFVNMILSVGVFYTVFYKNAINTPKTNLLIAAFLTGIFILLWRRLWVKNLLVKALNEKVAFWGDNELTEEVKKYLLKNPRLGFSPVRMPNLDTDTKGECLFFGREDLQSAGRKAVNFLVIDPRKIKEDPHTAKKLISLAVNCNIPVLNYLDFYEMLYNKIPPEYAGGHEWLFSNVLSSKNRLYLLIKDKAERLIALLLMIILLPIFSIIALSIILADRQNPIYRQRRVGRLGKEFEIWKFRTMKPTAEKAGPLYGKEESKDVRVTFVGRFLRRFRLDELSQLINVAKGEMSFIGPRPEWSREVEILKHQIEGYDLRHLVKPGMTGWGQINCKSAKNPAEFLERLHYDLYYIKNASLALDIQILLRTIKRIFTK